MKRLLLTLFSVVGCRGSQPVTMPDGEADLLTGIWMIDLDPGHFEAGRAGLAPQASAFVVLLPAPRGFNPGWISLAAPTHIGAYGLRRAPELYADTTSFPEAGARVSGDTIRIVLNPGPSHGSLVMIGKAIDGRILGQWWVASYVVSQRGAFLMRRLRR